MQCLDLHTALPPGRGDRAPPRKSPCGLFPGSPRKATGRSFAPPRSCYAPACVWPFLRAHGVRPSEKTTFHAIPELARQALLWPLGHLAEGRALHARKRKLELDRDISPFGRGLPLTHVVEMECLGPSSALPPGRFPAHPPGGAGSARPRERLALDRSISLLGHRPFVRSSVIMPYPGLALGLAIRTRGAHPSEKTAFRVVSGLFPQGHPSLEGPPRRGGLRTPVKRARA